WANNADGANGFVHGNRNIAERRVVDGAIEFVAPGGVREEAFDAGLNFLRGWRFADGSGETFGDFAGSLRKIFSNIEKNLCAIVRSGFAPTFGFAGGFYGVANVLAIAEGRFSKEFALQSVNGN